MPEIVRVAPREARESVVSGQALLVCAYDNEERFRAMRLEGAISLHELRTRLASLPREGEIVFYCA